jgi:hypothetical protein
LGKKKGGAEAKEWVREKVCERKRKLELARRLERKLVKEWLG